MRKKEKLETKILTRISRRKSPILFREDFSDLGGYDQVGRALRIKPQNARSVRNVKSALEPLCYPSPPSLSDLLDPGAIKTLETISLKPVNQRYGAQCEVLAVSDNKMTKFKELTSVY